MNSFTACENKYLFEITGFPSEDPVFLMHHWETGGGKSCVLNMMTPEMFDLWWVYLLMQHLHKRVLLERDFFPPWWTGLSCSAVIGVIVELLWFSSAPLIWLSSYHSPLQRLRSVCPKNVHLIPSFYAKTPCKMRIEEDFTGWHSIGSCWLCLWDEFEQEHL